MHKVDAMRNYLILLWIVLALWPKDVCFIFTQLLDFLSWLLLYLLFSKLCKSSLEVDKVLWARLKRYSWSNCYLLFVSKTFCNTLWFIVKDKKSWQVWLFFLLPRLNSFLIVMKFILRGCQCDNLNNLRLAIRRMYH